MRLATNSDVGFHNLSGTRDVLYSGQEITVASLYSIIPFDNKVKTAVLSGSQIKSFMTTGHGSFGDIKDGVTFENNQFYKVATNDYIFDQPTNPFIYASNQTDTGILLRDVLETAIRYQAGVYDFFLLDNPLVIGTNSQNHIFYMEQKKELFQIYL